MVTGTAFFLTIFLVNLTNDKGRTIVLAKTNEKERMNIALQKYVKKPYKK